MAKREEAKRDAEAQRRAEADAKARAAAATLLQGGGPRRQSMAVVWSLRTYVQQNKIACGSSTMTTLTPIDCAAWSGVLCVLFLFIARSPSLLLTLISALGIC